MTECERCMNEATETVKVRSEPMAVCWDCSEDVKKCPDCWEMVFQDEMVEAMDVVDGRYKVCAWCACEYHPKWTGIVDDIQAVELVKKAMNHKS